MIFKVLAVTSFVLVVVTAGCGLAIHFRWVGKMEPTPHIALGALLVLSTLATAISALITR